MGVNERRAIGVKALVLLLAITGVLALVLQHHQALRHHQVLQHHQALRDQQVLQRHQGLQRQFQNLLLRQLLAQRLLGWAQEKTKSGNMQVLLCSVLGCLSNQKLKAQSSFSKTLLKDWRLSSSATSALAIVLHPGNT